MYSLKAVKKTTGSKIQIFMNTKIIAETKLITKHQIYFAKINSANSKQITAK